MKIEAQRNVFVDSTETKISRTERGEIILSVGHYMVALSVSELDAIQGLRSDILKRTTTVGAR